MNILVAINKEDGSIMQGAKGQYAFGDRAFLGRSISQNYTYQQIAREKGVKTSDLYDVYEINVTAALMLAAKKVK